MHDAAEDPRPARSPHATGAAPAGESRAIVRRGYRIAALVLLLPLAWALLLVPVASVPRGAPFQPAQRLRHQGSEFTVLAGAGGRVDGTRLLRMAALGAEHLALQARTLDAPIDAHDVPILRYRWQAFPRTLELAFLFRRADAPEDVQTVTLPPAGRYPAYFDLRDVPAWRGRITEIGFVEYPTAQLVPEDVAFRPFALAEVELWSRSWRGSLGALGTDWLAYRPWALMSVSALGPDAPWPHKTSPTVVLAAGLFASAALCAGVLGRARGRLGRALCVALGVGWIALDLRWLADFGERAALTRELYAGRPWSERAAIVPDRQLLAAAQRVRELLARAPPPVRVVVAADSAYTMLRLGYHLLPANAAPVGALAAANAAPRAPIWLVTYAASEWRLEPANGTLRGPAAAYPATVLLDDGDLKVYRLDGPPR